MSEILINAYKDNSVQGRPQGGGRSPPKPKKLLWENGVIFKRCIKWQRLIFFKKLNLVVFSPIAQMFATLFLNFLKNY